MNVLLPCLLITFLDKNYLLVQKIIMEVLANWDK